MNNNDIKLLKLYFDALQTIPEALTNTVAKINATYDIIVGQETLASLQNTANEE